MPGAGDLRDRYSFQRQAAPVGDADQGVFEDAHVCAAQTVFLRGGEAVQSARLQGQQPVVLTIRDCAAARAVESGWRVVDARDPTRVFDVTGAEPNRQRGFIDVLATRKVGQNG